MWVRCIRGDLKSHLANVGGIYFVFGPLPKKQRLFSSFSHLGPIWAWGCWQPWNGKGGRACVGTAVFCPLDGWSIKKGMEIDIRQGFLCNHNSLYKTDHKLSPNGSGGKEWTSVTPALLLFIFVSPGIHVSCIAYFRKAISLTSQHFLEKPQRAQGLSC